MANGEYRPCWKGPPGPPPQPIMTSLAFQSSDVLREAEGLSFYVKQLILNVEQTLGRPNKFLMFISSALCESCQLNTAQLLFLTCLLYIRAKS